MIKVNGIWVPTPAGLDVSLEAIDKDGKRTYDGLLHRALIGKKYKFSMNWEHIPDTVEFNEFWAMLAETGEFFDFVAPTPDGDNYHEIEAYLGAMQATMLSYYDIEKQKQARWKSFKTNVIER